MQSPGVDPITVLSAWVLDRDLKHAGETWNFLLPQSTPGEVLEIVSTQWPFLGVVIDMGQTTPPILLSKRQRDPATPVPGKG